MAPVAQSDLALQRKRNHQTEMVLGSMAIAIPLLAIAAILTAFPASSPSASRSS